MAPSSGAAADLRRAVLAGGRTVGFSARLLCVNICVPLAPKPADRHRLSAPAGRAEHLSMVGRRRCRRAVAIGLADRTADRLRSYCGADETPQLGEMGGVVDLLRDACGVHKLNLASQLDTILARVHTIRTRMHPCAARTRVHLLARLVRPRREGALFLCLADIGQTLCELRETGGIEWASATIDGATLAPTTALSALPMGNGILAIEARSL